jgi:hypothetical protein
MTRLEKCIALKDKGYIYAPETGKIYGVRGNELNRKDNSGYIVIGNRSILSSNLYAHHFAWYWVYGNVDFDLLDHKDQNPSNNRIDNLRILDNQKNLFNTKSKGYYWDKYHNKWRSQIVLNRKTIYLGLYNTEEEARQAYLNAKKIYHKI